MDITALLGRIARARDRISMSQKGTNKVFQFLVVRDAWDGQTAAWLRERQEIEAPDETLAHAIAQLEEAVHDLKVVQSEIDDRASRQRRWLKEGQPK